MLVVTRGIHPVSPICHYSAIQIVLPLSKDAIIRFSTSPTILTRAIAGSGTPSTSSSDLHSGEELLQVVVLTLLLRGISLTTADMEVSNPDCWYGVRSLRVSLF